MKFCKTYIICTFSFLTIVRIVNGNNKYEDDGPEKIKLNDFFLQLQTKTDIENRKIFLNNGETSINTFFELSEGKRLWLITKEGADRTAHLLQMVISCEYSEYVYFWVKIIQESKNTMPGIQVRKLQQYQNLFYKRIQKYLSSMILTLVGLIKYTKHIFSKQHEVLNILLSWFIYIANFVNMNIPTFLQENFVYSLKSIEITNYQVEIFLKEFMSEYCQDTGGFENVQNRISNDLKTNQKPYKILFKNKLEELIPLQYHKFINEIEDQNDSFILTSKKDKFDNIIKLVKQQIAYGTIIRINWGCVHQENIQIIYSNFIQKNASDIKTLLKFERVLLQTITKIIIGFVSKILKNITSTSWTISSNYTNIYNQCSEIVDVLEKYIQKFKNDGQPSYLINNMSIIRTDLWSECFKCKTLGNKTDLDKYVAKLKELGFQIVLLGNVNKFENFLESLSKEAIYAALHPVVSNAFWEKLYFVPTNISEYIFDYKYLHMNHEVIKKNNDICEKISDVSKHQLRSIKEKIEGCKKEIKNESTTIHNCINELNSLYNDLNAKISEISSKSEGFLDYNWKKILLSLTYYIPISFDDKNNTHNMKILKSFQDKIDDYFEIGSYVTCPSNREPNTSTRLIHLIDSVSKYKKCQSGIVENDKNNNSIDISSYKTFFKTVNEVVVLILKNPTPIEKDLRLFLDGLCMSLEDVYKIYTTVSVDLIQENYDYFRFIVRWTLGVVYLKILNIVDGEVKYPTDNYSYNNNVPNDLGSKIEAFMNLPLYIAMPVKRILTMFVYILKSYDGKNKNDLIKYQGILNQELDSLGVIRLPSVITEGTLSDRFKVLIDIMKDLTSSYETYKTELKTAAGSIGIDQNDPVMMLHEWYTQKYSD